MSARCHGGLYLTGELMSPTCWRTRQEARRMNWNKWRDCWCLCLGDFKVADCKKKKKKAAHSWMFVSVSQENHLVGRSWKRAICAAFVLFLVSYLIFWLLENYISTISKCAAGVMTYRVGECSFSVLCNMRLFVRWGVKVLCDWLSVWRVIILSLVWSWNSLSKTVE